MFDFEQAHGRIVIRCPYCNYDNVYELKIISGMQTVNGERVRKKIGT